MTIKVTEKEKCISDVKINLMMQNSAEHAQLWPHSFIILTPGPALTLHEAERGKNGEKKKRLRTVNRRAERVFF